MLARRGDSWPCRLTRQRVQVPAAVDAALRSNPTGPAPLPASMAAHQQAADAAQMQQAQQANQAHLALMGRIVLQLQASPQAGPFLEPVPRDIPGYYDMIRTPMDLGTVASKLQRGGYPTVQHVHQDIMLMFRNCYQYNSDGSEIFVCAQHLEHAYRRLCKEARFM